MVFTEPPLMRRCLRCDHTTTEDNWPCPVCGFTPSCLGGFQCFSPELAHDNANFAPIHFQLLMTLEDRSFWFEGRNNVILWSLSRFFSGARNLMEIGVGTGFVMRALRQAMPEASLCGTDIYVEGLRFAAGRLGSSVDLFQMDATQIPFRDEFDVVCMFDVLEHIQDDEAVLRELSLAVKPGGGIIITVPQHMFLWGLFDESIRHKRRYGVHELERKARAAGFDVVFRTSFISLLLPFLYASRIRSRWKGKHSIVDEQEIHPALNWIFRKLLSAELALIRSGFRFPAGGSQLLVARLRDTPGLRGTHG
jgi:ubiquinone/menaquinone biosynthesis C-methylase UbiE